MPRRDYINTSILTRQAELREVQHKQRWRLTTLHGAIIVSLAIHAVLLTIRFVDPERFNRIFQDTPLEVILVNAKTTERAVLAQAIAQANLAGGGEAAAGRATSPLPPAATIETGDSLENARKQIERMQEEQQQVLAQIRRDLALLPPPDPSRDAATSEEKAREERRRQLLQLLAQIEKRVNEENARPKKRYISPATLQADEAIWYDSVKRRIEERGTRDFPEQNGKKLYGELIMNITIDADGRVIETDLVSRSDSRLLDRRAIAIVRAAGPYPKFEAQLRKKTDQLVVTSRFRFTRDEGFEATAETSIRR